MADDDAIIRREKLQIAESLARDAEWDLSFLEKNGTLFDLRARLRALGRPQNLVHRKLGRLVQFLLMRLLLALPNPLVLANV